MRKNPAHAACKLTPEAHAKIVNAVSIGATYVLAGACALVHHDTFRTWRRTGEQHAEDGVDSKFARLYLDVKKAESEAAQRWLSIIEKAAQSDEKHWTAAAWKLERRQWKAYGANAAARELQEELQHFKDEMNKRMAANGKENKQMDTKSNTEISRGSSEEKTEC